MGNMEQQSSNNQVVKAPILFEIWEWIKVIAIALAIAFIVRTFIAEPFVVDGASMDPTFKTGHFLIIDRVSYRFEEAKRGDIIVFVPPKDTSKFYIKRIIGLPNETITLNRGQVSVSTGSTTTKIDEPYISDIHRSYENGVYVLGKDEYFVMGDNRVESSDSRVWGSLKRSAIVGRPMIRLFPINRINIYPGEYNQN
jgi:signal peptidase I